MRALILILFLAVPFVSFAQNTWEKKSAFGGEKRSRCIAFSIGNRGYMGLGEDTADIERNDFWEYDPGTDSWMQKANFPGIGRRDAVGFAIGNKGYAGTGIDAPDSWVGNNLSDWYEYDPVTNVWTLKAACPSGMSYGGIYFATGFAANGRGFVLGGKLSASNYSNQLWEYNPTNNTWIQRPSFPGGTRYSMSSFVVNGLAYAGLGTDENILQTDWYEYNPTTMVWTVKTAFPGSGRFAAMGFAIGSKGYVVGGSDGGYKDELWQYDVASSTWWVKAPYGGGERRSPAGFVIANAAYVGTGKGFSGSRRDFWQYEQFLTGVEEELLTSITIYPNPAISQLTITCPADRNSFPDNTLVSVISSDGRIVYQENTSYSTQIFIDVSQFATGNYIVQVYNDQWRSQSTFIKQ
jgi:N-acetylneuraminic acid mutarotase